MPHASISWLLFALPFAACIRAAALPSLGRKREESSGSGDEVPAPLPGSGSAIGRVRENVGALNGRLASLDERLGVLAETNQKLVNLLRSTTAQLCLSQDEMGNGKDELACARARMEQLERLRLEQQQEIERGAARLRAVEAELEGRTRAADFARAELGDAERTLAERLQALEHLRAELAESVAREAERSRRCGVLEAELRLQLEAQREAELRAAERDRSQDAVIRGLEAHLAQRDLIVRQDSGALEGLRGELQEALRLQTEAQRAAQARAAELEQSHSARIAELQGQIAQREQALESLGRERAEDAARETARETARARRCEELEEELRLQVEEQRQTEARARELEQELAQRIAELEARARRRDEELRERSSSLESLREELARESGNAADRARHATELEARIAHETQEREAREKRVWELEEQLAQRERELFERAKAIECLRGELAAESELAAGRARHEAELAQQLEARGEELRGLREECAALSGRCQELARSLAERTRERDGFERGTREAAARIAELEAEGERRWRQRLPEPLAADELAEGRIAAVLHGLSNRPPRPLPRAWLEGLEERDLVLALRGLLGGAEPLSADAMLGLCEHWSGQHAAWNCEPIEGQVVYLWADAPFVKAGLGAEGDALLVVVAGMLDGSRRVVAVESGPRDSEEAWRAILSGLARRGMNAPRLVVAEDGLGVWPALAQLGWNSAEQRTWERRIEWVVEALPKRQQRKAGELLRAIAKAATRADASARKEAWVKRYRARQPEAVARLEADWPRLLSLYAFPAEHWTHLRNTVVVESLLSTLRLHTSAPKPHPSTPHATALLWKLTQVGIARLRKLNSPQLLSAVAAARPCVDGVLGDESRGQAD